MLPKRRIVLLTVVLSVGAAFFTTIWKSTNGPLEAQLTNASIVIDDGDPGFATTGVGWQRFPYELAYQGDMMSPSFITDPALGATWTFQNLTPGTYKVFVYFKAYNLLNSRAPYFLKDGDRTLGTVFVNQQIDATGNAFNGMNWFPLGTVSVQGTTLRVILQRPAGLTNNGVIADAVRIERVSTLARAAAPSTAIGTSPSISSPSPALPTVGGGTSAPAVSGTIPLLAYPSFSSSERTIPRCPTEGCREGQLCTCDPQMSGSCGCCPQGTSLKCQDPWTCRCQQVQCPPGYHLNEFNVCVPDAVCGDGYLDRLGKPQEFCEKNPQQGCPPDRICLDCQRCSVCGDTKIEGTEECEADYSCGGGRACNRCLCATSSTALTANVTATLDISKADVTRSAGSLTRASWSQTVLPGDKYDVYVWTPKLNTPNSAPCPISYWRVYNGSQEVRPLLIAYGSPLCQTWPGGDKTGVWIRIAQVPSTNSTLKVEFTPSNLPYVLYDEDILISIVKVVAPAPETPAPLGVTLIDDGDQGFAETGPYTETTGTYFIPWSTLDQGQPLYGDDYVDAPYYPSWSFTVNPGTYEILVSYRAPDQPNPGDADDRTYSIVDGWNNSLPPAPRGQELGPVTIAGSRPPDGPWFGGAKWVSLGTFTARTSRLTVTDKRGLFGTDAVRIVGGAQTSSQRSSTRSSSSARSSSSSPRSSSAASSLASSAASSSAACITESQVAHPLQGEHCCQGLSTMPPYLVAPDGSCYGPNDGSYICTALCGSGQCAGVENKCRCPSDCQQMSSASSAVSSAARSSSAVSSSASSQASQCAREGEVFSEADVRQCCADLNPWYNLVPNASGQCPSASLTMVCIRQCGDGACTLGENECNCEIDCPRPLSSASSAVSSAVSSSATCIAEGQTGPQSSFTASCCTGLTRIHSDYVNANGSCSFVFDTFTCAKCGTDGQCGSGENQCNCPTDCSGSTNSTSSAHSASSAGTSSSSTSSSALTCGNGQLDVDEQCDPRGIACPNRQVCNPENCQCEEVGGQNCGDGQLEGDEQCDGAANPCPSGQICTSACACVEPLPDSIEWQEVDKPSPPALGSTTGYGMFSTNWYMYAAGGQDFWGSTKNVWRSEDGKQWEITGLLPQKLSNAAVLPTVNGAILLGGLYDTNSVVNWAFEFPPTSSNTSQTFALSVTRYDGAALSVNGKYYFLGGTYKRTPSYGASLLGSLFATLVSAGTAVPVPAYDVLVHLDGGGWATVGRLPFEVTAANAFSLGNRLFIFSPQNSGLRDVYASSNGASWAKVSSLPALPGESSLLHPVIHKNAVWLIGKKGGSALASIDGIQWKVVNGVFPSSLTPENIVSFRNRLWMLGWVQDYYYNSKTFKVVVSPPFGCGNGIVEPGEGCDDGNFVNGDGCSSACATEPGWVCSHLLWTRSRCTLPRCGNGVVDEADGEQCDDGWQADGDGCSGSCHIEAGWTCVNQPGRPGGESVCTRFTTGTSSSTNGVSSRGTSSQNYSSRNFSVQSNQYRYCCSNGQCQASFDLSCSATYDACKLSCSASSASAAASASASASGTCGNGRYDAGEECDSTATSFVNPCGYGGTCGSDCRCVPATCGDGNVDASEKCDDGNAVAGDGCSTSCAVEAGWTCTCATASAASPWFSFQSFFASIFSFFTGQPSTPSQVASTCRSVCSRQGYVQSSSPTQSRCGNGVREAGEQCERGIETGQWTCGDQTQYCDLPPPIGNGTCQCVANPGFCGDYMIQPGEQCERGIANQGACPDDNCDFTTCQCITSSAGEWQQCPVNSGCSAALVGSRCAYAPPINCWPGSVQVVGTCGNASCAGACRRCLPTSFSSAAFSSSSRPPIGDINQCIDGLCCKAQYPVLEEAPYRSVEFPGIISVSSDDPSPLVAALSPDKVLVLYRKHAAVNQTVLLATIANGKPVYGPEATIATQGTPLVLLPLDATHAVIGIREGNSCTLRAISLNGTILTVGPASSPLSSGLLAQCRNLALLHISGLQFLVAMDDRTEVNVRIGTLRSDNSLTIGSPTRVNQGTPNLSNPSQGIVLAGHEASRFVIGIMRGPESTAFSTSINPLLVTYNGAIDENSSISIQTSMTIPVRSSLPMVTMTGNNSLIIAPVEVAGNPNRVGIYHSGTTVDIGMEGGLLRMEPMGSDGLLLVTIRRLSNSSYELKNLFAQENATGGWTFRPVVGCAGPSATTAQSAGGPVIEPLDGNSFFCAFPGSSVVGLLSCKECQNSCSE